METQNLLTRIVYLFILGKFVIFPLVGVLAVFINIVEAFSVSKKAGHVICKFKSYVYPKSYLIFGFIFLPLSFLLLFMNIWISLIALIFGSMNIGQYFSFVKYSKLNGVYSNGIILNDFIPWTKIHSYKHLELNKMTLLMKDGTRFDITLEDKINEVIERVKILKISEE